IVHDKELVPRLTIAWRNCASFATSASDGCSASIWRRTFGSRRRIGRSAIGSFQVAYSSAAREPIELKFVAATLTHTASLHRSPQLLKDATAENHSRKLPGACQAG